MKHVPEQSREVLDEIRRDAKHREGIIKDILGKDPGNTIGEYHQHFIKHYYEIPRNELAKTFSELKRKKQAVTPHTTFCLVSHRKQYAWFLAGAQEVQTEFDFSGTSPETTARTGKKGSNMKAQDHIGAHVNGLKSSIHALEVQITILKQLCGIKGKASEETEAEETETETEETEDEDFGTKAKGKKGKKAAKGFDDSEEEEEEEEAEETEEEEEEEAEEEAEEEEEEKPKKGAKGKKLTADDVNDACKERAGRSNRTEVLGILKKKFKVKSVSDLEPSQYADVIKAMKGK